MEEDLIKENIQNGIRKGVVAGLDERIFKGLEKSTKVGIEKAALHMLKNDVPIDRISEITGISVEQIRILDRLDYLDKRRGKSLLRRVIQEPYEPDEIGEQPEPVSSNPIHQGIKEGIKAGIEFGLKKGFEIWKQAAASYMLKNHVHTKSIRYITGLSVKQIEELEKLNWKAC